MQTVQRIHDNTARHRSRVRISFRGDVRVSVMVSKLLGSDKGQRQFH